MFPVIHNRNGMEDVSRNRGMFRRHSFSAGDNYSFNNDLQEINNSPLGLRRSRAVYNLSLPDGPEKARNLLKLKYNSCRIKDISAKDYVYCGMASQLPVNNLGMSIDNDGHLVLIKGKSYDLFKGLFKKYTTGYEYQVSKLTSSDCDKKFQDLYLDDNGLLIGNERDTGKRYVINLSIPETTHDSAEQLVTLDFKEYHQESRHDDLTFKVDKDYAVSYFMKDNKLYLQSIQTGKLVQDCSCLLYEIKLPLNSHQIISSIKKVKGVLQVEIQNGEKKRIVFIDPKHISNKNLAVSKISHKPPQQFSSRLGNDPHEKYHAGLPFTSDRMGNFSSKYIPLFSSMVDNFRGNVKSAKQNFAEGENIKSLKNIAKAIDPGISSVRSSVSGLARSASKSADKNSKNKEQLYENSMSKLMTRSTALSKLVDEALGVSAEKQLSKSLITLADIIKPRETVHLTSTDSIAGFFGIAAGGLPFAPGWFAGIVAALSEKYTLKITKTETGNISVAFNHRHSVGVTALAGTGQGLERTLLNANTVDYMTVMPLEANAIIATQSVSGSNFSFEMTEEHFREFAEQFSDVKKNGAFNTIFVDEAEAERIKENEFVVKIEAKSELRLQAGSMVNANTYMVMPRTAIGARLAVDLLNIKSKNSESAGKNETLLSRSNDTLNITALNHEAALFAEWKIMPIAMHGGGEDNLWCYPLPLLEEGKTLKEYKSKKALPVFSRGENDNAAASPNQGFIRINNIADINKTPLTIRIDDKKGVKKGIALKKVATMDREMAVINSTATQIKKALEGQQRASQNKYCVIEVVSHYERVASASDASFAVTDNNDADTTTTTAENNSEYRLKKLEFRRNSTLEHKKASVPLPILNFSTVHALTYDQLLGEIEFQYQSQSDLLPINARRNINVLY